MAEYRGLTVNRRIGLHFELNTDIPFSDNMWYCLYGKFVFFLTIEMELGRICKL